MTVRIALLRAVNVGGRSMPMADLRDLVAGLGYGRVRSILQSGNLVFDDDGVDGASLEAQLEVAIQEEFGFTCDVLVRSATQWAAIVARNPFSEAAARDPAHLVVMPLKTAPGDAGIAALAAAIPSREQAHVDGRELYLVYPDGIGPSRLTNAVIERRLGVRGTARNWNTVLKLAAAAAG